jgi:hypothetical protein
MWSEGTSCRFDQLAATERVSPAYPATSGVQRWFARSLLVERAPQSLAEKGRAYRNTTKANEVIAPQIPAQSASDRSKITIKVGPVPGRSSGARFWNSSAGSLQSFAV